MPNSVNSVQNLMAEKSQIDDNKGLVYMIENILREGWCYFIFYELIFVE